MFAAAANAPIAYMTWFDGQGYARFGPHGLLAVDGLAAICAAGLLYVIIRRFPLSAREPEQELQPQTPQL
jgi:hypothetical protein